MNFELVLNSNMELIETPIWDWRKGGVYWTDLFSGDVHFYNPAEHTDQSWHTGKMIGAAIPTSDENVVFCALEDGLYTLDIRTSELSLIVNPEPGRDENRLNDTRIDAIGRIFTSSVSKKYGTDDYTPDMMGGFYMIDTDKSVHVIEPEINQYNAIVWNHDNTKMFVVDTYHENLRMYPYDIEKGVAGEAQIVLDFAEYGMPDGMCIDAEDNLYICHWTGKISVWDKEYHLLEVIQSPVEFACCTGFGGNDMSDLYLATSKFCYGEEELKKNPGAGGLFCAKTDRAGAGDHYYPLDEKK